MPMADDDEVQSSVPTTSGIAGGGAAGVSAGSDAPERKMLTLPRDLARRVEVFRAKRKIRSDAEALRHLIERGLATAESPVELMERCVVSYYNSGPSYGSIIRDILEDHPLVKNIRIEPEGLYVNLHDLISIVHRKQQKSWVVEDENNRVARSMNDDEIPF